MLQISNFNHTHVPVASSSISLFLLGGKDKYINSVIKSIASSHCVGAACIEDTLVHILASS